MSPLLAVAVEGVVLALMGVAVGDEAASRWAEAVEEEAMLEVVVRAQHSLQAEAVAEAVLSHRHHQAAVVVAECLTLLTSG